MADESKAKTASEWLFEEYLNTNHLSDWEYEPCLSGQTKKPDYLLRWQGDQLLFEVKELRVKSRRPRGERLVAPDPCASLRSEIDEARKKFKALKDYCCSLVVHNIDDWTARLDPLSVFSAMLGAFGFQWTLSVQEGQIVTGPASNTFLDGGKMIRPHTEEPQNTTISSVVVLQRYRVPDLSFERSLREERMSRENRLCKPLTLSEHLELAAELCSHHVPHEPDVPRVMVVENPFARQPLPTGLFCGNFDERWRLTLQPECIFLGQRMAEIREFQSEQK